jgi:hypothetical protein
MHGLTITQVQGQTAFVAGISAPPAVITIRVFCVWLSPLTQSVSGTSGLHFDDIGTKVSQLQSEHVPGH